MGCSPQGQDVIYHWSHVHALQLMDSFVPSQRAHFEAHCCGPTTDPDPVLYGCIPCNFFIHKSCTKLPPFIRHPSHQRHSLTLVPASPYLRGFAFCDACRKPLIGSFFYHCTHCSYDLHAGCAFMSPTITHAASHPHALSLNFSSHFSVGIVTFAREIFQEWLGSTTANRATSGCILTVSPTWPSLAAQLTHLASLLGEARLGMVKPFNE
ncbi:hypothetical protein EJ110_NYTH07733 [Nymphaea thermarum]|nr:hypothetical protein EJ110_NYTH07733 [Nymphaea thermarum]